jgi:hypothetical protein
MTTTTKTNGFCRGPVGSGGPEAMTGSTIVRASLNVRGGRPSKVHREAGRCRLRVGVIRLAAHAGPGGKMVRERSG